MGDIIWWIVKIYVVVGIAFVIMSAWYDYRHVDDINFVETEEHKEIEREMNSWPWYRVFLEMAGVYLIAAITWPWYAYLFYEDLQYKKV